MDHQLKGKKIIRALFLVNHIRILELLCWNNEKAAFTTFMNKWQSHCVLILSISTVLIGDDLGIRLQNLKGDLKYIWEDSIKMYLQDMTW